jgi:hypothetical protein
MESDISYMQGTESRGYIMVLQSHAPHVLVSLTYFIVVLSRPYDDFVICMHLRCFIFCRHYSTSV